MSEKDTIDLLDEFINDNGLWNDFLKYVEDKGYKKEDLNMEVD